MTRFDTITVSGDESSGDYTLTSVHSGGETLSADSTTGFDADGVGRGRDRHPHPRRREHPDGDVGRLVHADGQRRYRGLLADEFDGDGDHQGDDRRQRPDHRGTGTAGSAGSDTGSNTVRSTNTRTTTRTQSGNTLTGDYSLHESW